MNHIKYIIIFIFICLAACRNEPGRQVDKEEIIEGNEKFWEIERMPNDSTKYETITTENVASNTGLINDLKQKLKKANFKFIEKQRRDKVWKYNNCKENKILIVGGNGIREYYAKSKKSEDNSDFYPYFSIVVYKFPTPEIALQNFTILNNALHSGSWFCNGKAPDKLVVNKNEVFHLSTGAEMFRNYIENYGEVIKNYR